VHYILYTFTEFHDSVHMNMAAVTSFDGAKDASSWRPPAVV